MESCWPVPPIRLLLIRNVCDSGKSKLNITWTSEKEKNVLEQYQMVI